MNRETKQTNKRKTIEKTAKKPTSPIDPTLPSQYPYMHSRDYWQRHLGSLRVGCGAYSGGGGCVLLGFRFQNFTMNLWFDFRASDLGLEQENEG